MKKVLFVVGPTAAGKSELAVQLALKLGGEIISADSMQVYRGMDIGTGKVSLRIRKKIPHHLIDIISPAASFSAFRFRRLALKAIKDISSRGKLPIVTGGSGLYVRALVEGISKQPGPDPVFRKKMAGEIASKGLFALYQKLRELDPSAVLKINPADEKRIIRALEIIHTSGKMLSQSRNTKTSLRDLGYEPVVAGITKERSVLYRDIDCRVDAMFRRGFIREVKNLMNQRLSRTAREAIGYREIIQALKMAPSVRLKTGELKAIIKRNTRRYAKRQMTWFRRERDILWFSCVDGQPIREICDLILQASFPGEVVTQSLHGKGEKGFAIPG